MVKKKVIFTDLDGTLLNKNTYSFKAAEHALEIIDNQEIPLIYVSSKTRAEIEKIRKKTNNNHPFISENGGGIYIPIGYFSKSPKLKKYKPNKENNYNIITLGKSHEKIIEVLNKIKRKIPLTSFYEMTPSELAKDSDLTINQAKLAKKREYDEPFNLTDKHDEKKIIRLIKKHKLHFTKGGRHYHILGNNDKGKAVKILIELLKKKYGSIETIAFGDAKNDKPMLEVVDKGFLIKKGPKEFNQTIIKTLSLDDPFVKKSEDLYLSSIKILKKLQFKNGAIFASSPKGRYPYVYPRDHCICILGLISARKYNEAKQALEFILDSQNNNGSFPQRLTKSGKDASYKPIQLDNTGLVLIAFTKFVNETIDKKFLKKHKSKINKSIAYINSNLNKEKYLFYSPNSIHEFPPLERGYEIWVNSICYKALFELKKLKFSTKTNLKKLRSSIIKYFWNSSYFIKTIRIKESSSVQSSIDASSYAIADFNVVDDDNIKILKTIKKIQEKLWHKKLGGICRYPEYIGRNNGGWGPWPHFTLMIARHYIMINDQKKAKKYLNWVIKVADKNLLPEHIALNSDFEKWVNNYHRAGLLRKDRKIMIDNIRKSRYYKNGIAYSVLPLAWPHAEFIRTWNLYKEKFM